MLKTFFRLFIHSLSGYKNAFIQNLLPATYSVLGFTLGARICGQDMAFLSENVSFWWGGYKFKQLNDTFKEVGALESLLQGDGNPEAGCGAGAAGEASWRR